MKTALTFVGAIVASIVIGLLFISRDASAHQTLMLSGNVEGQSVPDGKAEIAFNFFDKDTKSLVHRTVATAVVENGSYTASVDAEGLVEGEEYYVLASSPGEVPQVQSGAPGVVLLQLASPGVQQIGNVNISGRLISGALQTGSLVVTGNVGIGTTSPLYPLHVTTGTGNRAIYGIHTALTGTTYGVFGESLSTDGSGVYGLHTASTGIAAGVFGRTNSTSPAAVGILGVVASTSSGGFSAGVRGFNNGTGAQGIGVYGSQSGSGWGVAGTTPSGIGVLGWTTASTGPTYGGRFESASTDGRGVLGWAYAPSGFTYGGWFESASTDGTGVYGTATATSGAAWGVWGDTSSSAATAYGVFGSEPPGGAGHAVYAFGSLAATGTKSFQMDHPLRPETHYLNHFCTEGPEPYNAYRGNVVTDEKGYATITLPPYFESINRDPTYHLTVIDDSDDFVLAKVVRKIQNNQFVIRTNKPFVEVSWRVEAVRNDRWVQQYGYKTEQEKEDEIKGKYLHPELFGMPKEYGIQYRPDVERGSMSTPGGVEARAESTKSKPRAQGAKSK